MISENVADDHDPDPVAALVRTYRGARARAAIDRTGIVRSALAAAVPLHPSKEFHERSQRDRVL